ncbi:pentatricopeptide repeat-containing protein At5g27110 [Actinidia eriantha]|uniref:pentatricopeptide repeat-containing protein At5g27110 n=1 Tax=Actinidia eriantha TaxID=165200 RepID=UPI002585FA9C|nr:pentatricopeptide repeat-containing protein At5g27110 [Actinidia eriantha]XP_057482792.1 pentatricopeptide repeat-containing protein At5g27110 [Actinidia eriantha]
MNSTKLLALLRVCINSKSLKDGKLVHQKAITLGLQNNIALCKDLINFYFSCQLFESGMLVFQSIENPLEISLWNGLMAACTKNLLFAEAIELFERLLHFPYLKPDSYTYPSVLKACGGLGRGGHGQMVHTHVIKSGILTDIVVASSVVGMYAKCEMFGSALQLFDEMPERDLACWNTVISSYYHSGQCEKALELFEKMKDLGFEPNSVTITTAISSCARLLDLERGKRIHNGLTENGFVLDGFVSAALVDMYGKCGCLEMAVEVFDQMPMKSLVSWNSIIAGYSLIGDSNSCIELFKKMNEEGVKPTSTTLSSLLIACSRSANLQFGKFVHGYVIRKCLEADIFVSSSLLDLYFKCGNIASAENLFEKMPKANIIFWNILISGYVSAGSYFVALRIFNDLKEAGVKPDAITFTTILTACSRLAALEQGKEIHKCIIESKLESNEIVMGALLDMYAKCGAVDEALCIFNQLPNRDLVSWTSMITAYGSHGHASEALKLFSEMQQSNTKPDRVTFLAVMSACGHAGLVDEGCYYFNSMITDYGIKPTFEDYSCFIDLLGRAGRLHEAYGIIQRIPSIRHDVELLSTLFSACRLHGQLELGEEIARFLIEKDPDDPSTYIVLANLYASVKRWDEARKVRLKMKVLGLKKNPGCSWIEVGKRIQPFFVEDTSHPEAELVYDCLASLSVHMEKDELELN